MPIVVASVLGGLALATSVAVAGSPASETPGVPTSAVSTFGDGTAHYCVTGYAANAPVAVRNEKTGDSASIRTNHRGAGCTDVRVKVECGQLTAQSIVATGVGADGNPGTSSARAAVPGNIAPCAPSDGSRAPSEDTSSLSSTAKAVIAGAGAGGLALVAVAVILLRRRRSARSA
jgi:hypothetical protein